jgi:seryl-tRNA synthetase
MEVRTTLCFEIKGNITEEIIKQINGKLEKNILKIKIVEDYPNKLQKKIKEVKEFLGKNKIGVRNVWAENYEVSFELEKPPKHEFKVPFVNYLDIKENTCQFRIDKVEEKFIIKGSIERLIKLIKEKIAKQYYEGKKEYHEVIWYSGEKKMFWNKDPTKEMLKRGWIVRGPTKGKWIYRPQIVSLFRAMEKIVIEKLVKPLGFQEMIGSNIIDGEQIWMKTGHLEGMPMEMYYVATPISRDEKVWEDFIDYIKVTKEIPYDMFKNLVELKPLRGLTYAQCPVLYWSFKGKVIPNEELPILIMDRTQNSFRYESGGLHGIERVDEFHRIELVFIGEPDQTIEIRNKMLDIYKDIFENILELEWRMARVMPFYLQHAGGIFDERDKEKATIDFEAYLPYRGDRESSEWLEFQNITIVGDKYTKAFNIRAQKGELWSGCSGIGLQRWVVAFTAQHGLDLDNWPKEFLKYYEPQKGWRFLN